MKGLLPNLRVGTRSLKTTLALYFIPISVIPTLSISFYATRLFEENTKDALIRRAASERDAILSEIEALETQLVSQLRFHAGLRRLQSAIQERDEDRVREIIAGFRPGLTVRVYLPNGTFLAGRNIADKEAVNYLSKEGMRKVRAQGETSERFFSKEAEGFLILNRALIKDGARVYGILEEEYPFGTKDLQDLKTRREADLMLMGRDLEALGASFAISHDELASFSVKAFQELGKSQREAVFVNLGESRFAAFLFDLPFSGVKNKKWGYLGIFLPLSAVDATLTKLRLAMLYLTVLLILTATLAIFVFSNRIVKPIVILVSAMKRVKTGRVEEIPPIDSTYEIEYLVRSFNDMTRNISAAKRALELKLEELNRANSEIKNAQSTLVQSAKMISLGQIVAGVAHELNNPIGFIYSNMHHLSEYVAKIKELVAEFRTISEKLGEKDQKKLKELEKRLEVDYILRDMEELTQSCVEGAKRTKEIVLGLRTFSRVEDSSFRAVDLHEGLRSTIKLLSSEFKDRVKLHEEFGALPEVECNLSQMNQVFMNLISNAAQAIPAHGEIWVRTRLEGEEAVIEVEDNGTGIPAEALEKIFDPFFTTKKVGQGTGLGLSIAYGLVQKHHGTIEVDSSPGHGTCFTVRIPVRQPVILTA